MLVPSLRLPSRSNSAGFSLFEMAVVMVIMSLLLGGLLTSLTVAREISNRNSTENQLDEVSEALFGFAQATGRLPCPATATSDGLEAPVGGGVCTQQHGFVPSATLGLTGAVNDDGLLMDSWLSPLRYSVTTSNSSAFTTADGMRSTTMDSLTPDLRVCDAAACGTEIASAVPAILLSLGPDWGEFDASDVDATENSGETTVSGYRLPNDGDFVNSDYIEDRFDDMILWVSASLLYTKMISAGQLP